MNDTDCEERFAHVRCPRCASVREGRLVQHESRLVCTEPGCGMVYPILHGTAVLLTFDGDFYHLRKALDPAEIRVHGPEHGGRA